MRRLLAVLGMAMPVFAQYAGPAVLSRGEAPSAMAGPQLSFRPFLEVTGVYDTGLSAVAVNSQGDIANQSSPGVSVVAGISGSHGWKHTSIGLSYRGDYIHYTRNSSYDSTDHSFLLGVKHQFTRHVLLDLRESAGILKRDYGLLGTISPAVPFDPSQSYVPTTDFFDNRTIYGSSQADLVIQRSTRLSFDFGGDFFINRRASTALYGVTGESARGDVQYRLTRRMTVGGNYNYTHFSFNHLFSSTDIHGAAATLAYQLSRWWEFSGYGGFMRVETKFIQNVPVDPAVTAIIGITESTEVVYSVRYVPNISARLSRTFQKGVLYASGGHTVTPGNGLFLTSSLTSATLGYTYTGLRRWSFGANANYQKADSIGNVIGTYGGYSGTLNFSRQITRAVHVVGSFTARKYDSSDFPKYNSVVYQGRLGLGWAPGDVPLRIW